MGRGKSKLFQAQSVSAAMRPEQDDWTARLFRGLVWFYLLYWRVSQFILEHWLRRVIRPWPWAVAMWLAQRRCPAPYRRAIQSRIARVVPEDTAGPRWPGGGVRDD